MSRSMTLVMALVAVGCTTGPHVGAGEVKSATIGVAGGTLSVTASDDATLAGTSIYIPAGALAKSVVRMLISSDWV